MRTIDIYNCLYIFISFPLLEKVEQKYNIFSLLPKGPKRIGKGFCSTFFTSYEKWIGKKIDYFIKQFNKNTTIKCKRKVIIIRLIIIIH
jgi:hypothetical protein